MTSIHRISASFIFLSLFSLISARSIAQDSTRSCSSEINLSVNGLAAGIVGQGNNGFSESLLWKKPIGNSKYILRVRPGISMEPIGQSHFPVDMPASDGNQDEYLKTVPYDLIEQGPAYQVRRYSQDNSGPELKLAVGLERRFGKRKVQGYYGAEIFGSFQERRMEEKDFMFNLDFDYKNGTQIYRPDFNSVRTHSISNTIDQIVGVGISGIVGLRVPVTKRLTLSGEISPTFGMFFHNEKETFFTGEVLNHSSATIDFDMGRRGTLASIFIGYRFGKK